MATIEAYFKNKKLEDLETPSEAAARTRPPSIIVTLTPPIIGQVVDDILAGKSLREIKATVYSPGPQGQKRKLTWDQIRQIDQARRAKIAELTVVDEPINP